MAAQAATGSGLYVDIRASEAPGAPVAERWKLYGASHALVIGIDNYTNGWPRLSNAIKDATLVAEALRGRGFEVELLTDVTGDELRRALRRFFAFKGADPEARLFVWYAGHGHTENGEGYLVPADAPLAGSAKFNYVALHMGDVGSMVRIAQSKHVLAVFDACFAGTIFSSQRAQPPTAITAAVKRPVRQFLTSGDADQQVSDDGTFRTLFLRALRGEETADANHDGYLTGTELSFYLEDRMINLTRGLQTPRGGKLRDPKFDQGDFVFLLPNALPGRAGATAASPVTPAFDARALELAFWESVTDSGDPADFQDYLARYPDGLFSGLAKRRLAALTEVAAQPAPPQTQIAKPEQRPQTKVANLPTSQAASTAMALREIESYIVAKKGEFKEALNRYIRNNDVIDAGGGVSSIININVLSWDGEKYTVKVYYRTKFCCVYGNSSAQVVFFMRKDRNGDGFEVIGHKSR